LAVGFSILYNLLYVLVDVVVDVIKFSIFNFQFSILKLPEDYTIKPKPFEEKVTIRPLKIMVNEIRFVSI